ncbi:type II secretion system F family protein [Microbacterium betulae]|uniref:Type II secretion system F family protein n=1 Tax=Microbacterium betulae TaxID=2981139 RepID=A0AA97FDS7_9MICO|nr:type II secretion system F family protein [Microbacterium sp. AB]WOF21701.1 type II secretion system F family protein [Microbacterium sp. AB]
MSSATDVAIALLLGGAFGTGAWALLMVLPRWAAPSLARRVAPYVRDVTDPAGTTVWTAVADPGAAIAGGASAVWRAAQRRATALLGGADGIARRLTQAGKPADVTAFRGSQLAWALAGFAAGVVVVIGFALTGALTGQSLVVPVLGAVAGAVGTDLLLTSRARVRMDRIGDELPTVLEFLALCLAAGEGIFDSVARVAELGSGELTGELRRVVLDVRTGDTLPDALLAMSRRLQAPALGRAVEHVVAAIDRGSPLAGALQAQAVDAREDAKRRLIEQAGRKEILMLLPLVFGLLPLSVLFAVFPGIVMLRLGIG